MKENGDRLLVTPFVPLSRSRRRAVEADAERTFGEEIKKRIFSA